MHNCDIRSRIHAGWDNCFKKSDQCTQFRQFCSAPLTEYEQKRVFFIPPSVVSFSAAGKSFCILLYLASLGFANPLSIHMLFLHYHRFSIQYNNYLFSSQYNLQESSLFRPYPILENKRLSKSVLMIQCCTCFADVNECITGEHKCDAKADCNNTEGSFECTCKAGYSGNGVYCIGDYILVEAWIVLMLRLFQYHLSRVHAFEFVESKSPNVQIRVWSLASSTKWSLS